MTKNPRAINTRLAAVAAGALAAAALAGIPAPPASAAVEGTVVAWGDYRATVPDGLTGVVSIASGLMHDVALKADGTVVAWGYDDQGQAHAPKWIIDATGVAAGWYHSLALRTDGSAVAWGYDQYNQASVPNELRNAVAVAAGRTHSLILRHDGTVMALGTGFVGQAAVPKGLRNVVAIAAGEIHSLALKADGTVVAWGAAGESSVPAGLTDVVAIAAGSRHSLALKADGTVVAWGSPGQQETTVPPGLDHVVAVAAAEAHSVALKDDGTVVAWGRYTAQTSVPADLADVTFVSANGYRTFAVQKSLPVNVAVPSISGTVKAGSRVSASHGWWSAPATYEYQWMRCDADGGSCSGIGTNGTGATYDVTAADEPFLLRVRVTATGAYGSASAMSISREVVSTPVSTAAPAIAGTAAVGQKLTASRGTWTTAGPATIAYRWQRCAPGGADCVPIAATRDTYTLTRADAGHAVRVSVTVRNAAGSASRLSAATNPVAVLPVATQAPRVSGTARVGFTLTASTGEWRNAPTGYSYQWQWCETATRCGSIEGATSRTYALQKSDLGRRLLVIVTASNAAGRTPAASAATAGVAPRA